VIRFCFDHLKDAMSTIRGRGGDSMRAIRIERRGRVVPARADEKRSLGGKERNRG